MVDLGSNVSRAWTRTAKEQDLSRLSPSALFMSEAETPIFSFHRHRPGFSPPRSATLVMSLDMLLFQKHKSSGLLPAGYLAASL